MMAPKSVAPGNCRHEPHLHAYRIVVLWETALEFLLSGVFGITAQLAHWILLQPPHVNLYTACSLRTADAAWLEYGTQPQNWGVALHSARLKRCRDAHQGRKGAVQHRVLDADDGEAAQELARVLLQQIQRHPAA